MTTPPHLTGACAIPSPDRPVIYERRLPGEYALFAQMRDMMRSKCCEIRTGSLDGDGRANQSVDIREDDARSSACERVGTRALQRSDHPFARDADRLNGSRDRRAG